MRALVVAAPLFVLACGSTYSGADTSSSDPVFPASAYAALSTDEGGYRVEVRTAPAQPPVRGLLSVELLVWTAAGSPADGLAIQVVPWMASHAHGTSVSPTTARRGAGLYEVDDVDLFMPGTWELRVSLGGKDSVEHATVSMDVQ